MLYERHALQNLNVISQKTYKASSRYRTILLLIILLSNADGLTFKWVTYQYDISTYSNLVMNKPV